MERERVITLHDKSQATPNERMLVLFTALRWGWENNKLTSKEKIHIAKAACRQVAYDCGFKKCLAYSQLPKWKATIDDVIDGKGEVTVDTNPLSKKHIGSIKYVDKIEKTHPDYLRELFSYAQRTYGAKASWA